MPNYCSIAKIENNHRNSKLLFHIFPRSPEIRQQWIHRCPRLNQENPNTARKLKNTVNEKKATETILFNQDYLLTKS